jgi:hypothetical protein
MEERFILRKNEDGEVLGCENCDVEVPTSKFNSGMPRRDAWLCELCSSTLIGNSFFYRSYDVTPQMLAQSIHWLKDQLKK